MKRIRRGMKMPPQKSHHFGVTPAVRIARSKFDRSHGLKTTFDSAYLVPVLVDEVLPGDTFNCRASFFARLSTPLKPVMDNMYLESFFFFVPLRLLWTNWEKFNGAQTNPGDSTSFVVPTVQMPIGGPAVGTLFDYFGLPSGSQITGTFNVAAFWSRAYNKIWNEWFRDENLQNSVTVDTGDGPDTYANYVLKKRGKRHDYFTSCLPWPQKGTAVTIPAGANSAPVNLVPYTTNNNNMLVRKAADDTAYTTNVSLIGATTPTGALKDSVSGTALTVDPNGRLTADLSSAFATTINQLRLAYQTQALLERDARGGTRYTEILRSHFGVVSPDFRLQRSEYLGGGSAPINVHPVPLTTKGDGTTPGAQGNLAAFGTAAARGHGFNKSFTEHGVIIGLVNVRADLTYQQGTHRMWTRSTRYDFYWPTLAHIGEQVVTNKEIWTQGDNVAADAQAFGYQERHAEYRFKPSMITGKFRSDYVTTLDVWHLSQRFTSLPTLGDTFITEAPPISRVVAVTSEPQFILDAYFDYKCARPMPVYGVPGWGGRF